MAKLVYRATSTKLSGPDWATNMELCDILNADPGLAKEAVKAIKKRMRNKNPRVQLLALTVLETLIRKCGDTVHHQVAAKDVLYEMVKIAKKTKDTQVRDKILMLVDSWQEAFGGARGQQTQYMLAYDELRRAGFMFPRRTDTLHTQSVSNDPSAPHFNEHSESRVDASKSSEPGLRLTDIQNIRSGLEVLVDMLNALDPRNKQALHDEVIVELVEQCRVAEKRVMQLVNSTLDEELLRQGLSLNDDLKRVLAKHDSIASGIPQPQDISTQSTQSKNLIESLDDDSSQLSQRHAMSQRNSEPSSSTKQNPSKPLELATTTPPVGDLLSGDSYQDTTQSFTSTPAGNVQSQDDKSGQSPHMQILAQLSEQIQTSYVVPWAQSNGPSIAPEQQSSIYGQTSAQNIYQQTSSNELDQQNAASLLGSQQATPLQPPQASGQSISPQQQALIYGADPYAQPQQAQGSQQTFLDTPLQPPQASGQTVSPQQQALIYGADPYAQPQQTRHSMAFQTQLPVMSDVTASQHSSAFQMQHPGLTQPAPTHSYVAYMHPPQQTSASSQFQNQETANSSAYLYSSQATQFQDNISLNQQQGHNYLPSAPWSMHTYSPPVTQVPHILANGNASSFLQSSSLQHHYFQQPHTLPAGQASLAAQMQNMSLQTGVYSPHVQSTNTYMQQPEFARVQRRAAPMKAANAEDGMFRDLFDLAKTGKVGASAK